MQIIQIIKAPRSYTSKQGRARNKASDNLTPETEFLDQELIMLQRCARVETHRRTTQYGTTSMQGNYWNKTIQTKPTLKNAQLVPTRTLFMSAPYPKYSPPESCSSTCLQACGGLLHSAQTWHADAVLGKSVVPGVSQVVSQVVNGALASGAVLASEAQEGHHGQAPVLDLLQLQLIQLLGAGLGVAQGVEDAAWVAVIGTLEHALQAEESAGLSLAAWVAEVLPPLALHECIGEQSGHQQGACARRGVCYSKEPQGWRVSGVIRVAHIHREHMLCQNSLTWAPQNPQKQVAL